MAQIMHSDWAFQSYHTPLSTPNMPRQGFAFAPPPYVQRSDGLVIVSNSPQAQYHQTRLHRHLSVAGPPRPYRATGRHGRRHNYDLPPRQRQAPLHTFNNRPQQQPTDEDDQEAVGFGNHPTAEHILNSLPSVELSPNDQQRDCVICMMELDSQDKITRLPCGHLFHATCVLPWLNIRNTCPLCRFELCANESEAHV